MEDLGSLWNYQEDYEYDELKLKLQCTTIELESVKMEATKQIKKYRDEMDHLVDLLKLACQERDEARDQLQKLANPIFPNHLMVVANPIFPNHLMVVAKANSSTTESNSLSDTYNHHSHGSSPVDSLFDAVTSPDISSMNMADNSSFATKMVDPASSTTVIENIAKGKTLPEKGKLLQAVMETGPLLETLLVAGPLPQWRIPPPVSVKACDSKSGNQKAVANSDSTIVLKQLNSSSSTYPQVTRGTRRSCSTAMLGFAASGSASGLNNGVNSQITAGKRQRFH